MKNKTNIILWVVVICVAFAAAFTFYMKNKSEKPGNSAVLGTGTGSVSESQAVLAPDFSLKDLEGKTVKLSDYKGKIVFLNFWATWCKYCKQEMPDLNELNKELNDGNDAVILAVDSQESPKTVSDFIGSNNLSLHVLMDQDGSITQKYGVSGFPTTFVINKDGTVYTYIPGMTDKETLKKILTELQ